MTSIIANWRDAEPVVSHESAVVWSCMQSVSHAMGNSEDHDSSISVLQKQGGLTVHAIQGRRQSDHHKHHNREQLYYVIEGRGELVCGEVQCEIEQGDLVYLPSGTFHQVSNPNEQWLRHHVINMSVDGDGGLFKKKNWNEVLPLSDGQGAVRWHIAGPEGEDHVGCLRGLTFVDRETIQPTRHTVERSYSDLEQIYYILSGTGSITANGESRNVREGDAIHVPPSTTYFLANTGKTWLTHLIIAG